MPLQYVYKWVTSIMSLIRNLLFINSQTIGDVKENCILANTYVLMGNSTILRYSDSMDILLPLTNNTYSVTLK